MAYICNECGTHHPKWVGKCHACGNWETINEEPETDLQRHWSGQSGAVHELASIAVENSAGCWRTGVEEFDRVIGGGIMPASIGILGGEPGIGKSTLILQLLGRLRSLGKKCLYISGEEAADQIKTRSERLKIDQKAIFVLIESELERIFTAIDEVKPDFIVIDSVQTLYSRKFDSSAGAMLQMRECTLQLTQYAKQSGCTFLLIAHVTKEGHIAGPKTVEHMVDYLLYLEGANDQEYRYLRTLKNRFGSLREIGFFKMTAGGLAEVKSPNKLFMSRFFENGAGRLIFPTNHGSRVVLDEVQALVSNHPSNFPSRTTLGVERNRLLILLASLEKSLRLNLSSLDVYLTVTSGTKINDAAIDMAIIAAIYCSHKNISLAQTTAMIGEASLSGDFMPAKNLNDRLATLIQAGVASCCYAGKKPKSLDLPPLYQAVNNFEDLAYLLKSKALKAKA